jgi:transposase
MQYTYVGVDSHKDTHTAVFLDCFFEKLGEISFNNTAYAFNVFLIKAETFKQDGTTFMFGLEDVSSFGRALAIFLRDSNQPVKHVNAYLVARERKNHTFTEKTDSVDAECAARLLISKFGSLPDVGEDESYWLLRSLVVQRDFIMNSNVRLKTYLHSLLTQDFPQYHKFFYGIESKSAFAFFMKYPSAGTLKGVTAEDLGQFLWEQSKGYHGIERAQEILKSTDTNAPVYEIRNMSVQSTLKQYQHNMKELEKTEKTLAKTFAKFDTTLTSMTGLDIVSASQLLSCIGDIKKFPTPAKLAKYAGIAPTTYASGKKDLQYANTRGNRELNSHFYNLATRMVVTYESKRGTDNAECRSINPFFHEYYHRKISEGKTKRQALKCVQRRLVNIIWTMLTNNEEYINPPMIEIEKQKNNKQ